MSKGDKIDAVFSGAEAVLVGVREKIGEIVYDFDNEGQYVREVTELLDNIIESTPALSGGAENSREGVYARQVIAEVLKRLINEI